tara:strand:- start:1293 stop:1700 length:408 start_codon:yes stop_codon:yes gene_type:complete
MAVINFPSTAPSSRSFVAGSYPQTIFEAQNGTKSIIRYGNKAVNAQLSLGFTNVSDDVASDILSNYSSVNSNWDYISFGATNGLQGIEASILRTQIANGNSNSLKWRYDGPPQVVSVQPGINNVSCKFVACFDGD